MGLSLRPTGLRSPAFAETDYWVIEGGEIIGRICEIRHGPAEHHWSWSIMPFHVDPAFEITTNDRVPTLEQAKADFREAWSKVSEATKQKEQRL